MMLYIFFFYHACVEVFDGWRGLAYSISVAVRSSGGSHMEAYRCLDLALQYSTASQLGYLAPTVPQQEEEDDHKGLQDTGALKRFLLM